MGSTHEIAQELRKYLDAGGSFLQSGRRALAESLYPLVDDAAHDVACVREYATDAAQGRNLPVNDQELCGFIRRALRLYEATRPEPAPAPGAEAAIEALLLSEREYLRVQRTPNGGWNVVLERDVPGGYSEADGPTLSAALAALRGEAP